MKQSANDMTIEMLREFEEKSGLHSPSYEEKQRFDGVGLVVQLANPTGRFFAIAEDIRKNERFRDVLFFTLKKRAGKDRLHMPESVYLARVLSESLTINRFSFGDDFFSRYTKSVSNAEAQITAAANHVVFGRRGAGKSSLLLYAMQTRRKAVRPSAWIDMQVYSKRNDPLVFVDVMIEVLSQLEPVLGVASSYSRTVAEMRRLRTRETITDSDIRLCLPLLKSLFSTLHNTSSNIFVFLDDFHVIDETLQPTLLDHIYSTARGNNVYLKVSAIETLTRTWDAKSHVGLQIPHDAQSIKLDLNLTTPHKASEHIEGILDAHAVYCGLPSIRFLCNSKEVLPRLIWVSAGVPRDALSIFAQAMAKGTALGSHLVSVTHVNLAASEMVSQKVKDIDLDVSELSEENELSKRLEQIKDFCIKKKRNNAFLVEIKSDSVLYQDVLKLVDLRLLHVISEGLTTGKVGRKYLALILDYGFYTGVRMAQSIHLFNKKTERLNYRQLRGLPILPNTGHT